LRDSDGSRAEAVYSPDIDFSLPVLTDRSCVRGTLSRHITLRSIQAGNGYTIERGSWRRKALLRQLSVAIVGRSQNSRATDLASISVRQLTKGTCHEAINGDYSRSESFQVAYSND